MAKVLETCRREEIGLVVPLIDAELSAYARVREQFRRLGISISVSSLETVEFTADKAATHDWLVAASFPVPLQTRVAAGQRVPADLDRSLPLVAKPRIGSSSIGVRFLREPGDIEGFVAVGDTVVEELLEGDEYTVNVYIDRAGRAVYAVPHRRTAVRGGEVSKAVTSNRQDIIQLASSIVEHLPAAYGPINVQIFACKSGELKVTEINPRFSGGYPLAERAGARFPEWLIDEARGESLARVRPDCQDGVSMLRFDQEVFVDGAGNLLARTSHHLTAKAHDRCATTSLGSVAVLDGPSSTPPRADRRPPRIDAPLTHFRSPRGEKCGPASERGHAEGFSV